MIYLENLRLKNQHSFEFQNVMAMDIKTSNHLPSVILENLFLKENNCDIRLIFPNERKCKCLHCNCNEPVMLPAHRLILAQGSPVFQRLFYGMDSTKNESTILITDWASCIFTEFLQIFYFKNVRLTTGNIAYIMQLLVDYEMKEMLYIVEEFMIQSKTIENCLTYLDLTITYGLGRHVDMLGKLRQFCSEYAADIFKTNAFLHCSSYMLQSIFELQDLNCTEEEIFNASMNWSKEVCKDKGIEINDCNLRAELADSFYLIRFPTMPVETLTKCLALHPMLLTTNELLDILEFLTSQKPLKIATSFSSLPRMGD